METFEFKRKTLIKYNGKDNEIHIPEMTTSIQKDAFIDKLKSVNLYLSKKTKTYQANCFSKQFLESVDSVYFPSTLVSFNSIDFLGANSNPLTYAKHFFVMNKPGKFVEIDIPENIILSKSKTEVSFGRYPKAVVNDLPTLNMLNSLIKSLPDNNNLNGWKPFNFIKYNQTDDTNSFMYFIDVDINNDGVFEYRGVYATEYRCCDVFDLQMKPRQNFKLNQVYWFKYESLKWDKINDKGKIILLCRDVLDVDYFDYNKFYRKKFCETHICEFLNSQFKETAFSQSEITQIEGIIELPNKSFMEKTTIDNSERKANVTDYCIHMGWDNDYYNSYWLSSCGVYETNMAVHNISGAILSGLVGNYCDIGIRPLIYLKNFNG